MVLLHSLLAAAMGGSSSGASAAALFALAVGLAVVARQR